VGEAKFRQTRGALSGLKPKWLDLGLGWQGKRAVFPGVPPERRKKNKHQCAVVHEKFKSLETFTVATMESPFPSYGWQTPGKGTVMEQSPPRSEKRIGKLSHLSSAFIIVTGTF